MLLTAREGKRCGIWETAQEGPCMDHDNIGPWIHSTIDSIVCTWNRKKIKHATLLKPFRPEETALSKICHDNENKTDQFWPDAFRWQGEVRPTESTSSLWTVKPIIGPRLMILCSWYLLIQAPVRDPRTIKVKTGSFMTWVGKLKLQCS